MKYISKYIDLDLDVETCIGCRDGSAKNVKYGERGQEIDTDEVFFLKKGEALDEKY